MRKYALGFILGVSVAWLGTSWTAECTAPECNIPQVPEAVDILTPLPRGAKKRDAELHKQTQYLLSRLTLLEDKHRELCNHVYGCDQSN